jgi:hypothetical protein
MGSASFQKGNAEYIDSTSKTECEKGKSPTNDSE